MSIIVKMSKGLMRDIERQQRRKIEDIYNLQRQIDLARELRKGVKNEGNS